MPTATTIGSGPNGLSAAIVLTAARVGTTLVEHIVQIGCDSLVLLMKRSVAQRSQHIVTE